MTFKDYKYLVRSDLYRATGGRTGLAVFLREFFFGEAWVYIFWLRTCSFTRTHFLSLITLHFPSRLILRHTMYKLGIMIPYGTRIGAGFYIGHFGNIIINGHCQIGLNCNISPGVTLGQANRGKHKGYPVIGDNVYIGPGAKVIGAVKVGNNVAIGANSVVTSDVPDNAVVVGIPARVISNEGSAGYVEDRVGDEERGEG